MGELLPFIHRAGDSGEWTPGERARLEAFAGNIGEAAEDLELVFGESDAGDPWCAVKNADDEVLVHVARIGGRFVAHFTLEDVLAEGGDLYAALRDWLRRHEEGVVVPFGPASREGQGVIALLLVATLFEKDIKIASPIAAAAQAAFSGEAPHHVDLPPAAEPLAAPRVPEPQLQADHSSSQPSPAAVSHASAEPDAAPVGPRDHIALVEVPPAAAAPPAPPPAVEPATPHAEVAARSAAVVIRGTPGDDRLVGGPGAERLEGGDGHDTLQGGGGHDTLDGGRGDDRIELAPDALAIGGPGADTFVVLAPRILHRPDTLLGVVSDFHPGEGDRLVTSAGHTVAGPPPAQSFFLEAASTAGPAAPATPEARVDVDVDDDGVVDGFVLLRAQGHEAAAAPEPTEHLSPPAFVLPAPGPTDWIFH